MNSSWRMRSKRGETLAETLVSILVSSVALILLATAIGSSVRIIVSSRDKMEEVYAAESAALKEVGNPSDGYTPRNGTLKFSTSTLFRMETSKSENEYDVSVYTVVNDSEGKQLPVNEQVTLYVKGD